VLLIFLQHSQIVLSQFRIYPEMLFVGHHQVSVSLRGEKNEVMGLLEV
jgi:hypothetical protein